MTADQVRMLYNKLGFLLVKPMVISYELTRIQHIYDMVIENFIEQQERGSVPLRDTSLTRISIGSPEQPFPEPRTSHTFRRAWYLAKILLGRDAYWTGSDEFLYKPPYDGDATEWH